MRQQQWSAKNLFCKQKSIDDKTTFSSDNQAVVVVGSSSSGGRKILRKQLSVDHVTSSLKHTTSSATGNAAAAATASDIPLFWQSSINTENFQEISESNLKITNAIKKRTQFAVNGGGFSSSINK